MNTTCLIAPRFSGIVHFDSTSSAENRPPPSDTQGEHRFDFAGGSIMAGSPESVMVESDLIVVADLHLYNELEVRSRLGDPGAEFTNPDGSVTWEYTRQPSGTSCYMITIDKAQLVLSLEQVLNEANYARAREGMSQDEIRRLFGAPAGKVIFDNLREEVWEWRIEGVPASEETYLNAYFDSSTGLLKKAGQRVAMKG